MWSDFHEYENQLKSYFNSLCKTTVGVWWWGKCKNRWWVDWREDEIKIANHGYELGMHFKKLNTSKCVRFLKNILFSVRASLWGRKFYKRATEMWLLQTWFLNRLNKHDVFWHSIRRIYNFLHFLGICHCSALSFFTTSGESSERSRKKRGGWLSTLGQLSNVWNGKYNSKGTIFKKKHGETDRKLAQKYYL